MWSRILTGKLRDVALLTLQTTSPSLVYLTRLDLIERIFSEREIGVQRQPFQDFALNHPVPHEFQTSAAFIAAETPGLLLGDETGAAGDITSALSGLISSGMQVIAGATAAAALGEMAVLPPARPFPRDPADLRLNAVRGVGLLKAAAVLPYFDLVPAPILEQIWALTGTETLLIGIGQDAALIVEPGGAWCAGLGKVTLLRDNERLWEGGDGENVPPETVSLTIQR